MSKAYFRKTYSPFISSLNSSEISRYLSKLGKNSYPSPTLATMQELHLLHPQVFAFESLSPLLGNTVDLTSPAIFHKMVVQGRGGYCFEHNLLFGAVLYALGFQVKSLAARVLWKIPENRILPRDHMVLMVTLEEANYLVDVGFGGNTMTAPLRLDLVDPQPTSHEWFRLNSEGDQYILRIQINGIWEDMYHFGLEEYLLPDYQVISWYLETHPDSVFKRDLMVARTFQEGRYALKNNQFSIHYKDGTTEKQIIQSPKELIALLETEFNININSVYHLEERLKSIPWT
jgi:N-hydroxyarylamine O-acetyltransferase